MSPQARWWITGLMVFVLVAAVCGTVVVIVGWVLGWKWLAGLLAFASALLLRILTSPWSITIGGKEDGSRASVSHPQ
jgi:hypothetical protein